MRKEQKKHQVLFQTEALIAELKAKERIDTPDMEYLIRNVSLLLKNQPNVLTLNSPITIVGDIHGQFYDLVHLLSLFGGVKGRQWLFLGDFIDRGTFSIEVVTLLLALKLKNPQGLHLLRGNHQSRSMTTAFNFRQECLAKYDQRIYDALMQLFDQLPLCAVIDQKYFAVHAGISPYCQTIEDIQQINRFEEVPEEGGLCDLLWSDPSDSHSGQWEENDKRSCSYFFGVNQAKSFLNSNGLQLIIRGHQVTAQGFKYQNYSLNAPLTLTVFSAPNYSNHNKAAVVEITPGSLEIRTFTQVEHPVSLPNFRNLFSWSLPFLANCTDHLFKHLLQMAPITDKKMYSIMNSWQAFTEDYQKIQSVMLINQILQIQNKETDYPPASFTIRKSIQKQIKNTIVAKVIGPKLDKNSSKIGCIIVEQQSDETGLI